MNSGPLDPDPEASPDLRPEDSSLSASGSDEGSEGGRLAVGLLGAALLLGLLRFVRLGHWSLWLDEVYTWGDAFREGGQSNALGYSVVRWTVEALGDGPTEVALRMAPAVFGYLAIPLTYWAFLPLGGRLRAATAALVVAISAWEIQWSQTARFYTMVQFLGLLGGGLTIRGLLGLRPVAALIGMGIVASGYFFHLQGALLAGAICAAAFCFPPALTGDAKRAIRMPLIVAGLLGLLASPFIWSVFQRYLAKKAMDDPVAGVAHFALTTGAFVTPTIAALALGAWLIALRRGAPVPSFVGAVPVIGGLALACLAGLAKVSAQYAFAFFPWIALLAAWPIGDRTPAALGGSAASAERGSRLVRWACLLVLTLPLLSQTVVYFTSSNGQRARWREAVELVASRRASTDVIVGAPAPVVEFYLTGGEDKDVRHHDVVVQLDRYSPAPYRDIVQGARAAWFVVRNDYNLSLSPSDRRAFKRFLSTRCRMVEHFPVYVEARDLSVTVWYYSP